MNLEQLKKHDRKYVIYYLYLDGELQYVGQTRGLLRRIKIHARKKSFDEVGVVDHDAIARIFDNEERQEYMDYVEKVEILNRNPLLNVRQTREEDFAEYVWSLSDRVKEYIFGRIPSLKDPA